ncbi:unannotated protein [freshwater metagenome]|uniref:Unannotated protein n=1 Tax=freshwater metagenome TaxID=449393 RepID=A0A6J6GDN2_9ZZZZ|nr:hypothetical protein [Actinomycetota bacterium]MSW15359.1 hypothetical protein [Actinomycetota bacterium]MSW99220.1 hypothetical protein [Actinomycetota bacterium]MSY82730.1 hypothetical protein [Actinomycetota bacterium]MTA05213.1 hypothetical protein [Actinomycetota bacterium]
MNTPKDSFQDKALSEIKLIFQIIDELQKIENKSKLQIFENSLRFTFQGLAKTLHNLNEISPDSILMEKSAFLTPFPALLNISNLQPQLLALQKYLLASLL